MDKEVLTMQVKSKDIIGLPVISIEDGQQLGLIKGVVIDAEQVAVAALLVSVKGFLKENKLLPYNKVHSIGAHAITVATSSTINKGLSQQLTGLTGTSLAGTRVISERGNAIGVVDDFDFDTTSGKILSLYITGKLIEGILKKNASLATKYINNLGKDVIIAYGEAEEHLEYNEKSLQRRFVSASENTFKAVGITWSKTKELSKNMASLKEYTPFKKEQSKNMNEPEKIAAIADQDEPITNDKKEGA
ncbi:MAG: PRC-barrel domain-containing protein [Bacillota bacterium]|nr:PRC-barrel domain-containing protein [Bacillota bacterium]